MIRVGIVGDVSQLDPKILAETASALASVARMLNDTALVEKVTRQFYEGVLSREPGFEWYITNEPD